MKLRYVHGDLFEAPETYLAHGCNARGSMGAGVAKTLRGLYPAAFDEYRRVFLSEGLRLGSVIAVDCGPKVILNAITQQNYSGSPSGIYVDYDAVAAAMGAINTLVAGEPVAMPLIGAGLAGGSWKKITGIIEEVSTFPPVVYLIDGKVPES